MFHARCGDPCLGGQGPDFKGISKSFVKEIPREALTASHSTVPINTSLVGVTLFLGENISSEDVNHSRCWRQGEPGPSTCAGWEGVLLGKTSSGSIFSQGLLLRDRSHFGIGETEERLVSIGPCFSVGGAKCIQAKI